MTAPPVVGRTTFAGPTDVVEQLIAQLQSEVRQTPDDVASFSAQTANQKMEPNPPEDADLVPPIERRRALMQAMYGPDFPLVKALDTAQSKGEMVFDTRTLAQYTEPDDWCQWARNRWDAHRASVTTHLWLIQRNRLYRAGQMWVSSKGRGPWREPPKPPEQARVVHNLEAPALDQRLQVITEQRPGFQVEPNNTTDPNEKRKATGRQQALEYAYDAQHMDDQTRVAGYWAGTDGVAFWHVYWDRDAGPWDDRMGGADGRGAPLGDLRTQTLRCEQVRVSSNATAIDPPYYVVLRDVIPEQEAAWLYGDAAVQAKSQQDGNPSLGAGSQLYESGLPNWVLDITNPGEAERMRNVNTAERFTVYVDRHPETLPEGLQLVVVGNALVWGPDDLQFGVIPVIPVRDGSSDPSYFPRPIMEQWHDHQMQLNAALSMVVNSIRRNAGGMFLAKSDTITRESFLGGVGAIVEVNSPGPLGDAVLPLQGLSVGQDAKDLITLKIKALEDVTGYNDTSRGQIASDASGRAILAAREQLERVYAPPVGAVSKAFMQWGKVVLAGMAWGYDVPRDLGVSGKGRPDLARSLSSKDFEGPANVRVEPGTLMPMPKAFRLFLLDNWHDKGLITNQQYMRRVGFGIVSDIATPDEDQEARAKRIADAIRMGQPLPPSVAMGGDPTHPLALRWQDNEAIHQDVLEREVITQDDLPPEVIGVAQARWKECADQAAQKQGGAPAPGSAPPQAVPAGASPFQPGPARLPIGGGAPLPVPPPGASEQEAAAHVADLTQPQG